MGDDTPTSHAPAAHYNRVHDAWRLIMGEEFHYGYFESPQTPLSEATAALTRQMLDRAGLRAGDRVLDVGCGTGRQACDLALDFGVSVLGITTSTTGVEAATELAGVRGADAARFEERDGTANGLPADSFDVVWVLESSHLMQDRRALLSECVRVLAPGGRIVLCDIIRRREIPFLEVRERRADLATLRAAFGEARMEPLESYASTLEELGADLLDSTDISDQTLPTFAAWRANVGRNADVLADLLGEQGVDDFVRSCDVLESFWHDRTLGYGILSAAKPA